MQKYAKKIHHVEAVQLTRENFAEVKDWCGGTYWSQPPMRAVTGLSVKSIVGEEDVPFGYWIVKGPAGGFFGCPDATFHNMYEIV